MQLGDGSTAENRKTPGGVSGLSSGVTMIAVGGVRFVGVASLPFAMEE